MSKKPTPLLTEFLQQYSGLRQVLGTPGTIDYCQLSIDSRTLEPGQLFVAIRGENHDGHNFVGKARQAGAAAVVVSNDWFSGQANPQNGSIVVEDTLDFLQQLSGWHRRHFRLPVIGLTGSNGKTTTRAMISALLQNRFVLLATEGNKNNHIGLPLTLLKLTKKHQMAVLEMGTNHPGEIGLLAGLAHPTSALITNVGKGHLGFFGSLTAVFREKTALFDAVKSNGALFINAEDPLLHNYQREDCRLITVGMSESCNVSGRVISVDERGCVRFRLDSQIDIQLAVPGEHQLMNALMAVAVARFAGIPDSEIRDGLETFQPADQRMQWSEKSGIRVINDAYNANPDSVMAAIDVLDRLPQQSGKKWIVIGDMLELGDFATEEHRAIGEYLATKKIDGVFLYGPFAGYIKEGIEENTKTAVPAYHCSTHEEISRHLRGVINAGDVLLVKGSRGMRMENVLKHLHLD